MPEQAGELEDLGTPKGAAAASSSAQTGPSGLSMRARFGLFVGLVVFTLGALLQIIATAWLALLLALFGGSAEVLVHTGGLEPRTFAASSIAAVVIDVMVLLAMATHSVRRSIRRMPPGQDRFAARHPFTATSLGMALALAFVIACGWRPSPYFPYPLATIIVLASAYWFGLVGVFAIARLADLLWRSVRAWGLASEWRAGFLTAVLLLAGGAGYWLLTTRWYAPPLDELQARLEIDDPRDRDALANELDELCLAANQLEPVLVHTTAAPACRFLDGGNQQTDNCFSTLMTDAVPQMKQRLRHRELNDYDVEDAIMKALLATCTREPPPTRLADYFFIAARNETWRMAQDARRTVSCDQLHDPPETCSASDPPEIHELKLAKLWDEALCKLDGDAPEVVRRHLQQGETFSEIGEHLRIGTARAKNTFYNAIKKLRRLMLAACDDGWI
jgi:DNA-directed RNA polymerase specialized sigma24 family protein